ncbi:hypothetical protein EVAR_64213_1 [Eumeta japonica]|uniref:Uncharacterized protein n=1 Tax=Eumeta variegata TaxID=151549 RepID=A0A4C1Z392_EUMVA|nr:hypothetical protein EVAR_64213_1 [Eumeta japonica]
MDDPPDDTGQPPANVLPSLLAPPSPASFTLFPMLQLFSSQPPLLNDVPSLPHLSTIAPQPSLATPDLTSPSTKSVRRLEYNNNDTGSFIINCQRIEASPFAGSVLHPMSFGEILQSANVKVLSMAASGIGRAASPYESHSR